MILAVLQARMASTRMPGKVMAPVLGEPMIWRQIERVRRARSLSKLVVATSTAASDDALAGFLDSVQIEEVSALDRLDQWVELEMARHWQVSADFLKIAVEAWPKRLAELGLTDVSSRRVALLRALAARWRDLNHNAEVVVAPDAPHAFNRLPTRMARKTNAYVRGWLFSRLIAQARRVALEREPMPLAAVG